MSRGATNQAADAVRCHDVQRVVEAEPVLQPDRQRGHDAGDQPDRGRAERLGEGERGVMPTSPATAPDAAPSVVGPRAAITPASSRSALFTPLCGCLHGRNFRDQSP